MFENITFDDPRWFDTTNLKNEKWCDIRGYEGIYAISNYGRVKRINHTKIYNNGYIHNYSELILKPQFDRWGYMQVHLCSHQKKIWIKVHRIEAELFLEKTKDKTQVNHIDGNKSNPRLDNLEWVTPGENQLHAIRMGLKKNNTSRKVLQFDLDGNFIKEYPSLKEAGGAINRHWNGIYKCCAGKTKFCGGFIWKYKEII